MDIFLISESTNLDTLVNTISSQFPAKIEPPWQVRRTYYDTFDWALYNNGLCLYHTSEVFSLCSLEDNSVLQTIPHNSDVPPDLSEVLPDSAVSGKLKQVLAIRPLLARGTLQTKIQTIHILDGLEKTVVHVIIERTRAGRRSPINLVILKPVKGYRRHHRGLSLLLSGIGSRHEARDAFGFLLGAAGAMPGDSSSNMRVQLNPDMTARQAAITILKRLLEVMRQNAPGITEDVDTECVHDFRVAVRRTRSALRKIKCVFPDQVVQSFRDRFSDLGRASNTLRDLDVYLQNRRRYEEMLPAELRSALAPLFEILKADRDRMHREFSAILKGRSLRSLLQDWEEVLNNPARSDGVRPKNADRPALQMGRKYILRQHSRVIALGSKVNDATPDREMHALRIQCKHLRYLLEFFSSLFPQEKVSALIAHLKTLQDNLGEYNDLSLQQSRLRSLLPRATTSQNDKTGMAVAIGGLITVLYRRQQDVRRAFEQTFGGFSATDSTDMYRELFE
jgi:CHAD domain-containing protein